MRVESFFTRTDRVASDPPDIYPNHRTPFASPWTPRHGPHLHLPDREPNKSKNIYMALCNVYRNHSSNHRGTSTWAVSSRRGRSVCYILRFACRHVVPPYTSSRSGSALAGSASANVGYRVLAVGLCGCDRQIGGKQNASMLPFPKSPHATFVTAALWGTPQSLTPAYLPQYYTATARGAA